MVIFWTIISILLLALAAAFFVLQYQAADLEKRKKLLEEAFWERRNRLPLLIELTRAAKTVLPSEKELIELREKSISETAPFGEMLRLEREMKKIIHDSAPILMQSKNTLILALVHELSSLEEGTQRRANDYNYVLSRRERLYRYPWFRIFKFLDAKSQNTPVVLS